MPSQFPIMRSSIISVTQASVVSLLGRKLSNQQSTASFDLDAKYSNRNVAYVAGSASNTIKCLTAKKVSFSNVIADFNQGSKVNKSESVFDDSGNIITNPSAFNVQLVKEK